MLIARFQSVREATKMQVGSMLEDPMEELMQLRQVGDFQQYQEVFDILIGKVDLNDQQKVSCYLGGLKQEISLGVKFLRPRKLYWKQ
ncbi:hypothetical protein CR513_01008, partial [Mucuna pruriens]